MNRDAAARLVMAAVSVISKHRLAGATPVSSIERRYSGQDLVVAQRLAREIDYQRGS